LHLHARRIRIDAPDGGKIDVTAELPAHFAESLAMLGFEASAGDALSAEKRKPEGSPQRKVAAAAKARRRERRGERRARGSESKAKRR
jgi:23S rRNA pseudouridine955/2504/2580 synthase